MYVSKGTASFGLEHSVGILDSKYSISICNQSKKKSEHSDINIIF